MKSRKKKKLDKQISNIEISEEEREELKKEALKLQDERKKIVLEYKERKYSKIIWFFKILSFIAFGTTLFYNPFKPLNIYNLGFGIFICLLLNLLLKYFYRILLTLFNPSLKKVVSKKAIYHSVNRGMVFVLPFAATSVVGAFVLNWNIASVLLSASIMSVGMSAAGEINRLAGKNSFKNTIITSFVSYSFSFLLTYYLKTLVIGNGLVEGAFKLIPTLFGKGGGIL